jgi:hypothetical protein
VVEGLGEVRFQEGMGWTILAPEGREEMTVHAKTRKKTARLVKVMDGYRGDARLYKLSPPLKGARHVIVSAVNAMYSGDETYIFKADAEGQITDWLEMEGSFKGGLDHEKALRGAGYEVVK